MTKPIDTVIIGGGIIGLSIALELAAQGQQVTVLDQGGPGLAASSSNGGGIRQQGRAIPELGLAQMAVKQWEDLENKWDGPTGFRRIGHLMVAANAEEFDALTDRAALELEHGLETEIVDAAAVAEFVPGFAPGHVGGKFSATDGMAVPAVVMQTLVRAATRMGVDIRPHTPAIEIEVLNSRVTAVLSKQERFATDLVINAAGAWSPIVASMVKEFLPVAPSRVQMHRTKPVQEVIARTWVARASMDLNMVQWPDGSIVFGGGTRPDPTQWSFDTQTHDIYVVEARKKLSQLIPSLSRVEMDRRWAGVREFTPDMIPIIGFSPSVQGVFNCTGFSGHGFALGPLIGELVADWLVSTSKPEILSPFTPERFVSPLNPFNHPPAPWGGATTQLAPSTVNIHVDPELGGGFDRNHSGAPAGLQLPELLEES